MFYILYVYYFSRFLIPLNFCFIPESTGIILTLRKPHQFVRKKIIQRNYHKELMNCDAEAKVTEEAEPISEESKLCQQTIRSEELCCRCSNI